MSEINFENIRGMYDASWKNFEHLCASIVQTQNSTARTIEGKGGDEGIDIIIGNAEHIYQAKYFTNTLKSTQRKQIEKSLKTAIEMQRAKKWTLCIAKDLTPAEDKWFLELASNYPDTHISYWNATFIINKVMEFRYIRETFFPPNTLIGGCSLLTKTYFHELKTDKNSYEFYLGTRPSWNDIVAKRDIKRDLYDDVMNVISTYDEGLHIVSLLAHGGNGKSTFLLRIAYDLAQQGRLVLYRQRDEKLSGTEIKNFCLDVRSAQLLPVLIVDDFARIPNFDSSISLLKESNTSLVIILASRPYELGDLFKVIVADTLVEFDLNRLSNNEIYQVIDNFAGLELIKTPNQQLNKYVEHYAAASDRSFLVLTLLLLHQDNIEAIIQDELVRIKRKSEVLYNAYIIICLLTHSRLYATRNMLKQLLPLLSPMTDLSVELSGLIEYNSGAIYCRHDKIADLVVDNLIENYPRIFVNLSIEVIEFIFKNYDKNSFQRFFLRLHKYNLEIDLKVEIANIWLDRIACSLGSEIAVDIIYELSDHGSIDTNVLSFLENTLVKKMKQLRGAALTECGFHAKFPKHFGTINDCIDTQLSCVEKARKINKEKFLRLAEKWSYILSLFPPIEPVNSSTELCRDAMEILYSKFPENKQMNRAMARIYVAPIAIPLKESIVYLEKALVDTPSNIEEWSVWNELLSALVENDLPTPAIKHFIEWRVIVDQQNNFKFNDHFTFYYVDALLRYWGMISEWMWMLGVFSRDMANVSNKLRESVAEMQAFDLRLDDSSLDTTSRLDPKDGDKMIDFSYKIQNASLKEKREIASGLWKDNLFTLPGEAPNGKLSNYITDPLYLLIKSKFV